MFVLKTIKTHNFTYLIIVKNKTKQFQLREITVGIECRVKM